MLRIALVEDNPADAQLLRTALERAGLPVEIMWFEDGVQASERITRTCDLVLLDLNLPRMSGFEVLEHIRQTDDLRSLPVIVMSGSSDPADIERSYVAGANSYVCKPVHLDSLFEVAKELVIYWSKCAKLPARGMVLPDVVAR